jgi:5-methylcytosine-specific restriction endonuclease McrA
VTGRECDPEKLRAWGAPWARRYPADVYVARFSWAFWSSALQVDHRIPLALVCYLPPDERRSYFGPTNLQLLCHGCHKEKTREDTARIRAFQAMLREEGLL